MHVEEAKSGSTMSFMIFNLKNGICDVLVILYNKATAQPHLSPNRRRIGEIVKQLAIIGRG